MLGFSFRFWNRAGAIRRRRICGRYGYHTTETILPRRICGRCCYHDGGDGSADAAVTMLFAAVGVEVLGSETTETDLRTLLLPCYLQLLGCRCWGARRRRRICGRCCYHAICSCWGAGAGERDGGDESADAAVTMLFAAVGVEVLGSETTETNLRTLLLPCYLQLLGCRCWGARLPRRICGRWCYYHAICSCWGAGAGERDYRDESADAAVTMLFAAVGVEETNLRTLLLPCYLQLLGWRCWGARLPRRICGRCCCHAICSCWGGGAGERDYRDESADAAVTMLFAAVGVQVLGSETEETNLRTLLLPCYLRLLGCRCWGARRRRRICGRCCYHAICSCWGGGAGERDGGDESADAAVAMLFAAVGVEVLGSETTETNLRTLLLPCYLQLLGCKCWGARLPRRICGRCCCHAICSCWGGGAGERDYRDESADAAVTMLFAAVGVQVLGSETTETNLRTLLLLVPCYLQLLGCRCWGARLPRRICGRCCYHAICSCWGAGAGERDYRDESADAAVTMLFAAVGVQVLGSETEETNLRTLLLPCYLQLLGWRCWGARRRRRICGRCCCHAICSCCGGGAGERDYRDESADAAVAMLFAAVQVLGSETTETNLRTLLLPCYLQLLGCRCWGARRRRRICGSCCYHAICCCWGAGTGERDGGDESADAAVTMLFAAVGVEVLGSETEGTNLRTLLLTAMLFAAVGVEVLGSETTETNLRTLLLPCYCGAGTGEGDGGDESADAADTMLFAAVGVEVLGSETEETNLRTLLLPCYLQLQAWSCWGAIRRRRICGHCCSHAICRKCWGAIRRRRICGRCCCHAICSCWGGGAGERDYRDESADAAVAMLFAAVGVEVLGSETTETNLRTLLLPCYLQLLRCRYWGARRRRRICGRCCYHAICSCWGGGAGERDGGDESADAAVTMLFAAASVELLGSDTEEMHLRTLLFPCYLQLLGWRCWGARRRRRICGRCCCHAICSCWGGGGGERDGGDESADGVVAMLFAAVGVEVLGSETTDADAAVAMLFAAVGVEALGSETTETNLRTLLLPCYLQLLGCRCRGARWRRRICGRCCYHAICSCWGAGAGERDGGDESADAAVPMLFAAVGVELLGSETEETNLRTLLFPCYLQLLGWRCWGARRRRRICGRCCYHAICGCWGAGAGERDGGDESADAAVTMLFAAVGVQVVGSDTEETNVRTLLLPCYLQLLGCRCWGARRRRRICGRCCCHAICSCWGGGAGERDCGDESADGAVAMLFAAVGVEVLGSETAETNLRTVLLPCYLQLLGCSCWGAIRRRGDEVADAAVTMRIGDWGRRRRSCGRWWWRMLLFKQAEFKGSGFWTPYFLISKSFVYRGRLF